MSLARLKQFSPDIVALQECRRPNDNTPATLWQGDDPVQGVALIDCRTPYAIRPLDIPEVDKSVLIAEFGATNPVILANVWAQRTNALGYDAFTVRALRQMRDAVGSTATFVVVGDFNSTPLVAKRDHDLLIEFMRDEMSLVSAYHSYYGVRTGDEAHATHYYRWKQTNSFHLDYVFVPLNARVRSAEVGSFESWNESDHRPLVVEFE